MPPPQKARALVVWQGLAVRFVGWCHEILHTLLFRKQFVPCCTTKYIFKLGKNKFDRGGPLFMNDDEWQQTEILVK